MKISEQFERYILQQLIVDERFFNSYVTHLLPTYFMDNPYRAQLLSLISDCKVRGRERPSVGYLAERIQALPSTIQSGCLLELGLIEETEVDMTSAEVDELLTEFIFSRSLRETLSRCIDHLEAGDYEQIRRDVDSAFDLHREERELGLFYFDIHGRESRMVELPPQVPTPWPSINKVLRGGLGCGELGLIIAPPKSNKTQLLLHLILGALLTRTPSVYFSMEVAELILAARLDALLSGREFDETREFPQEVKDRVSSVGRVVKSPVTFKQYPSGHPTVNSLRQFLLSWEAQNNKKVGLVIVDYADLMAPEKHYKDPRHNLNDIYVGLRGLAVELQIPLWTASQTNKDSVGAALVEGTDVAEDFRKIATADFVMSINQTDQELRRDLMRLFVTYSRNTKRGISVPMEITHTRTIREIQS